MKSLLSSVVAGLLQLSQALAFLFFGPSRVGITGRFKILAKLVRARLATRGLAASSFGEQLFIVRAALNISADKEGVLAEFGCYKGAATIALSIAAKFAGRRLIVFDSFEGLPEPEDKVRQILGGKVVEYKAGEYAGSLEDVRKLVTRYGFIESVEFVRGFFCDTLPGRPVDEKYVLIFEDADLVQSVRDVLQQAWPRLQEDCPFFSHEALDLEVAKLFFDDDYWQKLHRQPSPGLAGVDVGLPLNWGKFGSNELSSRLGSSLAVIVKRRG